MMTMRKGWVALFGTIAAIVAADRAIAASADSVRVTLHPRVGPDGAVIATDITEEIGRASSGPFSLTAPDEAFGNSPLSKVVQNLTIHDEAGPATVTDRSVKDADGDPQHRWDSDHPLGRTVTVRYSVPVADPKLGGPPFAMKAAGGGVAGHTSSLLLEPAGLTSTASTLQWDLGDLPKGSVGVSSVGPGTVSVKGDFGILKRQWLLAGPAVPPRATEQVGLNGYILGALPFDGQAFLAWATRAHATLAKAFGAASPPHYELFIRGLPGPAFATATSSQTPASALLSVGASFPADQDYGEFRMTTVHELTHQWVGLLTPENPWFDEGLTVYSSIRISCDAGLVTPAECAKEIDATAKYYYISRGRSMSEADIDRIGFRDEMVRRVPYGRGMLYFALLDSQIRARSHGKATLMIALRPLFAARAKGTPLTRERFEAMLSQQLGTGAVAQFRRIIIDGAEEPVPPSNAFGPRLVRREESWDTAKGKVAGYRWQPN